MSHNQLTEIPQKLSNLRVLDFSVNILGVLRASDTEHMALLTHLNVSGNEISRWMLLLLYFYIVLVLVLVMLLLILITVDAAVVNNQ